MNTCVRCKSQFEHLPDDIKFYKEYDFPSPELCPDCRHQNRIAYRNERVLYRRNCDLCGNLVVSIFSINTPFPVYCSDCWWGNKWDAIFYGCEFDFSRPFFEQFFELRDKVPRQTLNNSKSINSEFCSQCIGNKDCYLLFAADENQNSMHSYWINRCIDVYNSSWLSDCTLCIDLVDAENCYKCVYSQDLINCSECYFSYDLIGCKNCFACAGLRNKDFYIKNQPHTKEEYFKKINSLNLGSYNFYSEVKKLFRQFHLNIPHKYVHIFNSEKCLGDYISNSNDCNYCFDVFESEKCSYAFNLVHQLYNIRDCSFATEARNIYQGMSTAGENVFFSTLNWFSIDTWYSDLTQNCSDVFGCVGLRHKKFCIFNKQYSESDYYNLKKRIIEHMKKTGEWGKFFPVKYSPFAYNETIAQDYFPLSKNEVLSRGWKWHNMDQRDFKPQIYQIPDNIQSVSDNICDEVLACDECGKNYKVLLSELKFYKQMNYPVPRKCTDCRFTERLKLRNPRKLFNRECAKCLKNIKSTYSPNRLEKVYCEECYLKEVY
ncbi:hypothetical protein JW758_00475 [Candidatus Peregrinibacteria bacterium]|nr:hypothetical protein [Candidatus Peregrinibacteria bacterium]